MHKSKPARSSGPSAEAEKNNHEPVVARTKTGLRTRQIVAVIADGSTAQVTFWQNENGIWRNTLATRGYVGANGVGLTKEGRKTTPVGAFPLGPAFGTENPGTELPFRQITPRSWWVEDSASPDYNSWQEGDHFNPPSEHLADYPDAYRYAVVIQYNRSRTPYAGSGFFLHCATGGPTAGCVSVPADQMQRLVRLLRPGAYIINGTSEQEVGRF
ncbi:L,D-transpeptidase family protein [Sporolactobacillus vineae]|uniref:L,D-transpeptidase family protein n=1 Tax=Sporolactobacillus vineae TaxID=444463 RepID=UPI000289105D|nr:L,D-transpeptidase family protein [Sporolactobacillus vineae]